VRTRLHKAAFALITDGKIKLKISNLDFSNISQKNKPRRGAVGQLEAG
jgi:hypothetical protein